MKVRELLDSERKWVKGTFYARIDGNELGYCLIGAINTCYKNSDENNRVRLKVQEYLNYGIAAYNDRIDTTFQDIRKLVETLDI